MKNKKVQGDQKIQKFQHSKSYYIGSHDKDNITVSELVDVMTGECEKDEAYSAKILIIMGREKMLGDSIGIVIFELSKSLRHQFFLINTKF